MYAVVKTGGKQYRVAEGEVLRVEKLIGEPGEQVELTEVLAVGEGESIKVGTPLVDGAKIVAEILEQGRGKKIIVFRKRRRKGFAKRQGHRQSFTAIKVKEIRG